MNKSVYIESSVISYLTARRSRDLVIAGHQAVTAEWWDEHRLRYDVYVLPLVVEEISAGDASAAEGHLRAIADIPSVAITADFEVWADMRYEGQSFDLPVTAPEGLAPAALVESLVERFEAEHESTYGHRARNERVVIVAIRLIGRGASASDDFAAGVREQTVQPESHRDAWFGPGLGWMPTPVVGRGSVPGGGREGPLLVEEYDSVIVVPPGCTARSDPSGSVVIAVETT